MKHIDSQKSFLALLFVALTQLLSAQQYLFVENFNGNYEYPPTMQGWIAQNNSSPVGDSWFLGNPNTFAALTGADSSYLAVNYESVNSQGNISNWALTPELPLANGNVFQFFTRTSEHNYADRMQVYLSTAGTGTDVGTTATSVGTFSTLLADINPSLTVTGYPLAWTAHTFTLTNITGTNVTGRFGFRYFVTNGGENGTNSNYIGIDSVTYYKPGVTTGIKTVKNSAPISLYPNPFKNELMISGTSGSVQIYDVLGKLTLVADFENGAPINTEALEKGIYIVRVMNNNKELVKTQKISKD